MSTTEKSKQYPTEEGYEQYVTEKVTEAAKVLLDAGWKFREVADVLRTPRLVTTRTVKFRPPNISPEFKEAFGKVWDARQARALAARQKQQEEQLKKENSP